MKPNFGSDDATYMRMPEVRDVSETTHAFVKLLDDNLSHLWEVSKAYQSKLVKKRAKGQDMAKQNQYQPGDLVLFRRPTGVPLPTKLTMKFMGPFEVFAQKKNDIECRHLCTKALHTLHVERLKAYFGSREDAEKAARIDYVQHVIEKIFHYRGNPLMVRSAGLHGGRICSIQCPTKSSVAQDRSCFP